MSGRAKQRSALLVALLVTGVLAWFARDVEGLRRPYATIDRPALEAARWYSIDPDGLYHTRRVERALREGLPVAERDPYLSYPDGARIPWPPYYDTLLALLLDPFVPAADEARDGDAGTFARRAWIERAVATLPAWFGLGAVLLAGLAAFRLTRGSELAARLGAVLAAGTTVALCRAPINYSAVGNGDHHAWIALLNAALLLVMTAGCCRGNLERRGRSLALGIAGGLIAGLMLGSWVAALMYVINVQLALAWFLFRRSRDELPGVAALGLGFHLAALAAILPAVLSSPWCEEFPWMAVNLSWFHPAQLLIGALVFVPPLLLERGALATGSSGARRYPWLVAAALAAGAGLLWLLNAGPARGVADGFAWVSRADAFMATVLESTPLIGSRAGGWRAPFDALGYGVLLLPLAYVPFALSAFRGRLDALIPFAVALPPLLLQALNQRRFAEVLAVPMAVCLGWAAARLATRLGGPRWLWAPAGLLVALGLQGPSVARTFGLFEGVSEPGAVTDARLGDRLAYEWIRTETPDTGDYSVLAHWDRGHAIEWAADRPTVATNFGSYVGVESYRAPARFFLAENPLEGRAILQQHRARYVFVPGSLSASVEWLVRIADPELGARYLEPRDGRAVPSMRWLSTLGARLLTDGVQLMPPEVPFEDRNPPLGFLRLVYVSPYTQPDFVQPATGRPMPAAFVWEHVPGATIAARGAPGELAQVDLAVRFRAANYRAELTFIARCDATGIARLWIPYSTEGPVGNGLVERASWTIGGRSGALAIPESAVQGGPPLEIP